MAWRLAWCGLIAVTSLMAAEEKRPAATPLPPGHAKRMTAGLELFERSVASLLKEHCVECHSGAKAKSDFDLATREGLLKGGSHGPTVVPFNAAESALVQAINHAGELQMPHKKPKLPAEAIEQITRWIDAGAPYAEPLIAGAVAKKDRSRVTEQDRLFRSFQPLSHPQPPAVKNEAWVRMPIDQFILAELEKKGIAPNGPIERRKLIRRVYFDLIGLPPLPEEVEAFVASGDPKAYEKLVDRLLASPHHGERWGRHWLDLARFGESHGYEQDYDRPFAYPYRDFVIRALNDNLPFDTFVRWQIAGDELAPDNPQAWFATGFLGAGTHATQITINQAEKERYDELDDQINTIGTAMLGLTMGCARCHDHKFDPIPTQDYYRLISTFTTTVRSDQDIDPDPARTRTALARWEREHKPLVEALERFEREELPARLDAWLKADRPLPEPDWLWLNLEKLKISGGYRGIFATTNQPDGSLLIRITTGAPDTVTFTTRTTLRNIAAVRLEALTHKALPDHGPGWSRDGGFELTELAVNAAPLKGGEKPVTLKFVNRRATNDREPPKSPLPWRDDGKTNGDVAAVFELQPPAGFAGGTELSFTLKFPNSFDRQLIGRMRVSLARRPDAPLAARAVSARDFETAAAVLTQPAAHWKPAQRAAVSRIFAPTDADWQRLNEAVVRHAKAEPRPQFVKALVCSEGLPAIRLHTQGPDYLDQTHFLKRGDPNQKQDQAAPGFLQVLMRAPEKNWQVQPVGEARTPGHRAALARWITDVDDGAGALLARVIVNRLWQHHLGRGIVSTPSDFGATGDPPTHPELLDWLAGRLIQNGWRLKPLHKMILTSAVYLQDTASDARRMQVDPENRLWWRRAPQRLDAEIIRDNILAVSGRLDRTMFGPGSLDEGMNRRSVYFTIKRSQLIPMMLQFDWPDSLQGVGLRVNTTVAPQALLLMNNPHVRAAAHAWAGWLQENCGEPGAAVTRAYLAALGRAPTAGELKDSVRFLETQAASYRGQQHADPARAALTDFCQTVLSLNEFIYVE